MGGALGIFKQSVYKSHSNSLQFSKKTVLWNFGKSNIEEKSLDPAADTTALEAEIDQLVYALYGLTVEEMGLVEG